MRNDTADTSADGPSPSSNRSGRTPGARREASRSVSTANVVIATPSRRATAARSTAGSVAYAVDNPPFRPGGGMPMAWGKRSPGGKPAVRFEELVLRIPGDEFRVRFHDQLTVLCGIGMLERQALADSVIGALTGAADSTVLTYTDNTG